MIVKLANFPKKTNSLVVVDLLAGSKSCKKSCPYNFWNIYRKAPVLESLLDKVAGLQDCSKLIFYTTPKIVFFFV